MPAESLTAQLINNVCKRLRTNHILKRFQLWMIVSAGLYVILLLLSRLLAIVPDIFTIYSILIPLLTGFMLALIWPLKIKNIESARAIDSYSSTDDLFLTAATISSAKGEFQGLVQKQAEQKADSINAQKVIPLAWHMPAKAGFITLAVLCLAVFSLPQLDPFGKEQARKEKKQRNEVLAEARKETEKRLEKIKKAAKTPKDSDAAKMELTKIFKNMKKQTPKKNIEKLRQKKREIARLWSDKQKQLKSEKKGLQISNQKFGVSNKDLKKISKDLKNGKLGSAAKKLQEMMKEAEELAEMNSSPAKKKKADKLKKDIEDLKDLLNDKVGNESVKAAMNRALNQMSEMSEENKQALKDAAKSLDLSQRELSRLQKLMDEMKDLQELMQTAGQAEQMAQNGKNPKGEGQQSPPNYESFQEYQDYFNQQNQAGQANACQTCAGSGKCKSCNGTGKSADGSPCADCKGTGNCKDCAGSGTQSQGKCSACNGSGKGQSGQGQCADCNGSGKGSGSGNGTGNPGGGGGTPGENDTDNEGFKKEQSKSQMQAGRTLMEWKTKGVSEKGEAKVEYTDAIKEVREGVDEAITNEKIPPGYHEVIKKYFSSEEDQPIEK